ncbi:phage tail sheath C-terminal domain-containing protein, partial [Salmonella enterica]|uniref:phage tail sheath C-terminal domain-containing protein n=1 Tax=Salmonella enterica TaxID=28901 RepID=UPI003CEAA7A5
NLQYSSAELQTLAQAGIDLITNPIPAGSMFGVRIGHNTSSNPVINGDNYTRMTNYLAFTLNSAMGKFVGRVQSTSQNDPLRRQVDGTISSFMQTLIDQGMLDSFDNKCDLTNNPPN